MKMYANWLLILCHCGLGHLSAGRNDFKATNWGWISLCGFVASMPLVGEWSVGGWQC